MKGGAADPTRRPLADKFFIPGASKRKCLTVENPSLQPF